MTSDDLQPAKFDTPPGLVSRILGGLAFAGLAPVLWWFRGRIRASFIVHQHKQALATMLLLLPILVLVVSAVGAASYILITFPELSRDMVWPQRLIWLGRKLFLCWLVFWFFGLGLALRGSMQTLPLVGRLARNRHALTLSAILGTCAIFVGAVLVPLTLHADALCRQDKQPGKSFMLYDDVGFYPEWLFELGYYRMALASEQRWGKNETVVLKLSKASIERALGEGEFIFFAAHGLARGMLVDKKWITPRDLSSFTANDNLKLVYLGSCESGRQRQQWESVFAPAELITFNRFSAMVEHIWWLWVTGPKVIRGL